MKRAISLRCSNYDIKKTRDYEDPFSLLSSLEKKCDGLRKKNLKNCPLEIRRSGDQEIRRSGDEGSRVKGIR